MSVPIKSPENKSMALTASLLVFRGNLLMIIVDVARGSGMKVAGSEMLAVKEGGCESSERSEVWRWEDCESP